MRGALGGTLCSIDVLGLTEGINYILYSFYTLFLDICYISFTNFSKRNFQNSQPKLLLDEFEVVFFNGLVQFFSGLD